MSKQLDLTYAAAGVDINAGNQLVENIKSIAKATHNTNVLSGLGGFAALYQLPINDYKQPVLVSCTDGVGTKLKLALAANQHHGIGADLVAMCANDLVVCGAKPLYFLDYYATAKLDIDTATTVVRSIGDACREADMALTGGETAELPGMYQANDYDLAGFCVGIVDKAKIIDGSRVKTGDTLIGIASSGPHSNGYSLIRKILELKQIDFDCKINQHKLIDLLLTPTRIYVKSILQLKEKFDIHAMAHITGGGLLENIPRVLPAYHQATINTQSWQQPEIFTWLQQQGNIKTEEMYRTFNCGIGMVLSVAAEDSQACLQQLSDIGEKAYKIGRIEQSNSPTPQVVMV